MQRVFVCARMPVPRVGLGLSASVDKEQMATLTGQKNLQFPHSRFLFSLHFDTSNGSMASMTGTDLYLNV